MNRYGADDAERELAAGDDLVAFGASLDGVVRSLRGPSRREVGGVFGRWADAVGEQVAQHVKPLKLDGGVLTVEVDDPAWATQVKFLSSSIISRLREVAGVDVEQLAVRVDARAVRGSRYR